MATPSNIYTGQKTITAAGTAEALASSQTISQVTIRALTTNTDSVWIGDSTVDSSTGYPLEPGEGVLVEIDNLSTIYVDSDVNSEGVAYLATG